MSIFANWEINNSFIWDGREAKVRNNYEQNKIWERSSDMSGIQKRNAHILIIHIQYLSKMAFLKMKVVYIKNVNIIST